MYVLERVFSSQIGSNQMILAILNFVEFLGSKTSQRQAALARMLAASEGAEVSEEYVAELERMRLAD